MLIFALIFALISALIFAPVFAPAECISGSLLFEDLWPSMGDLDFNDVVLTYNSVYRLNPTGHVASLRAALHVLALGAGVEGGRHLHGARDGIGARRERRERDAVPRGDKRRSDRGERR